MLMHRSGIQALPLPVFNYNHNHNHYTRPWLHLGLV